MEFIDKRKLDSFARVVLPSELRNRLGWEADTTLDIYLDGATAILKKGRASCIFCHSETGLLEYRGHNVCEECCAEMQAIDNPAT